MADIKLFKSAENLLKGGRQMNKNESGLFRRFMSRVEKALQEAKSTTITKADSVNDLHHMTQAIEKSIGSIIADDSLSAGEKAEMMADSLQHFTMDAAEGIQKWSRAEGVLKDDDDPDDEPDDYDEDEDPDDDWEDDEDGDDLEDEDEDLDDWDDEDEDGAAEDRPAVKKGADFNMAIDIAKMSPEDQATLAALEKKYTGADADTGSGNGGAEMHPEVKKALDEVAELKKAMEMTELTAIAKKYEAIGKKADELAGKLYELKKAGEQHYNDYVALLDEQLQITNASGVFKEYGSNRAAGASDLGGIVAEIRKADPSISYSEAVAKAYETHPNLDQFTGKLK